MNGRRTRPWLAPKVRLIYRLDDDSEDDDGSVEHSEVFGQRHIVAKDDLGASHTNATDLMGSFSSLVSATADGETDGGDGHESRRIRFVAHGAATPFAPKEDKECHSARGDAPHQRIVSFGLRRCDAKPLLPGPIRRWRPARHCRLRLSAASWVADAADGFRKSLSGLVSQLVQQQPIKCQHTLLVEHWDDSGNDDVDSVITLDDRNLRVNVGALPAPSICGDYDYPSGDAGV